MVQHVQQTVPGLLRTCDRVKETRAPTSERQHSAAAVARRPSQVNTVARSAANGSYVPAHFSAGPVTQHGCTGTAVLPIVKDRQWFMENDMADVSSFQLIRMSQQEWLQMGRRLEVSTFCCSSVLMSCRYDIVLIHHICHNMLTCCLPTVLQCNNSNGRKADCPKWRFEKFTGKHSSKETMRLTCTRCKYHASVDRIVKGLRDL